MKKIFICLGISLGILLGVIGYNSSTSFAGKLYPMESHSFELTQYDNEGLQTLEITIDKNGYFFKEVKNGSDIGNFELWDGQYFYRYIKEYNDLMVVNSPKEDG
ncbi:hypothetical protein, partial [Bacillus timonensis]|uniref:hypothetical protein n=1 Tax=Bacillus timonensis TaxID=1033734 RepID=UPI000288EEA8